DFMQEWVPRRETYMEKIISLDGPPPSGVVCWQCSGMDGDPYRCLDCVGQPIYCTEHMRSSHGALPLHRIEKWVSEEGYFAPAWLGEIGVKIFLGHQGAPCDHGHPEEGTDISDEEEDDLEAPGAEVVLEDRVTTERSMMKRAEKRKNFTWIVDTSGISQMELVYCSCRNLDRDLQCLELKLWPASFIRIKTVFTFRVLEDFRLDNLESRTSAYHYFAKLRRRTNPNFPHTVPDRYRELLRVSRQWRNVMLLRERGFGHTKTEPKEGELAIFCPACPQPGINLPENWDRTDPKFTRQLAVDGNFVAYHIANAGAGDNVWLMDGQLFMAKREEYLAHLQTTPVEDPRSTCHNHRAQLDKNMKTGNRDVTGIGAVACARHGCFCPGSVVDFQKGERQANIDYALAQAFTFAFIVGILRLLLIYDIACQYYPNLSARWSTKRDLYWPEGLTVEPAIGLLHVHGHLDKCMAKYSASYVQGMGRTDGEIVESLWSTLNDTSRSTQTASLPHRAEVLGDHIWDSNWKKHLTIGPC
ncbi:hypothetical protein BDN72DRAFT_780127, partial [Pluteus cervinus]